MRPARQSAVRYPLDDVLGTVSTVRVLRELVLHGQPLSPSELAERVSLSKTSVGQALTTLSGLEVVAPVGSGRYTSYRLRPDHFLACVLGALFEREAARAERLFDALRDMAEEADPAPRGVWIYGSVARGQDRPTSDLDIVVVAGEPADRAHLEEAFGEAVLEVATSWSLSPSVIVTTEQEVARGVRSGDAFFTNLRSEAVPVWGSVPGPSAAEG